MQHAKKMVMVPHETLAQLQVARQLEQTPTTRIVHGLDADMRQLLDRQDLTEDEKIKQYHQTLQRYLTLNRQRRAPLTMTLHAKNSEAESPLSPHPKVAPDLGPPTLKREVDIDADVDHLPSTESYGLSKLFAEASHLPPRDKGKRKTKRKATPKWTSY